MDTNYLKPDLNKYKNFQELLDDKNKSHYFRSSQGVLAFEDLVILKEVFLLAEPGYGKTRLLKEIFVQSVGAKKTSIFIDLKKVSGDLEEFIKDKNKHFDIYTANFDFKTHDLFRSKDFKLQNISSIVICLDGLDEVQYQHFARVVESIKMFIRKYDQVSFILSCRYHHFQKNKALFTDLKCEYVRINPFSLDNVREYLNANKVSKHGVDRVLRILEFRNRDLIIQTPRYLEMLVGIIRNRGEGILEKLSRTELFEMFIYKKLEIEDKNLNLQKKEMIKRLLEKVALIMEIYQTNLLKKEELITILDDVQSNLSISFLSQVPLEVFYDKTVLKDNIDTLEFENTEFQEYLASKEIIRLGKVEQTAFDLVVNQDSREILPSWFNTLSFLVEQEPGLLRQMLEYVISQDRIIRDEEYFRFLTKIDSNALSLEDKTSIFEKVFLYYQNILHWIPIDIGRSLTYYFVPKHMRFLEEYFLEKGRNLHFVEKANLAFMIAFLVERDLLTDEQKVSWKNRLVEFAKDNNGVVQRHSLFAIGKMGSIQDLMGLDSLLKSGDKLVVESFIDACKDINPNDNFSIKAFVEGSKQENIHARYALYEIRGKKALKELLDYFAKDERFLFSYIDQQRIFESTDHKLLDNIAKNWDSDIGSKIDQILRTAFTSNQYFDAEDSLFIEGLVKILREKYKNYIFDFLGLLDKDEVLKRNIFILRRTFSRLLHPGQVNKFVKIMKKVDSGEGVALWTLNSLINEKDVDLKKVYEEGRSIFPEQYKQYESKKDDIPKSVDIKNKVYKEFKVLLEPSKGQYSQNVFDFYLRNKKNLILKKTDQRRLEKLITNSIFKFVNPSKGEIKWTADRVTTGARTYTIDNKLVIFGQCLIIAVELNIDVSKYRSKIISYIPFAYSEQMSAIFTLVPDPQKEEIDALLKIYSEKRKDDLFTFLPHNIIEICDKYKLKEVIPILKAFVDDDQFSSNDKQWALRVIGEVAPDRVYFNSVVSKYSASNSKLADIANGHLITKFEDTAAIKWRLTQLKERHMPYKEPEGVHFVKEDEAEFHDKKFAEPLLVLKNPNYVEDYLRLLDSTFEIWKKGEMYYAYTTYLWDIVIKYFDNLKEQRKFEYYKELEQYVKKNNDKEGINWFSIKLPNLLRAYLEYIGKPPDIAECIKGYNKLKSNSYLSIATPRDLYGIISSIIREDIPRFIEAEGFYKTVQAAHGKQEDMISKTLKIKLENCFLRRGFRENEFRITREEQLLDDKRTDYLISYGFVGPILIEIKRLDNKEVCVKKHRNLYKNKLLQYVKGTGSHFGIFLIFRINDKNELSLIDKVKDVYKDYDYIDVHGIDCLRSSSSN